MLLLLNIFIFLTLLLILFYVVVWGRLLPESQKKSASISEGVSVVICGKNEAVHLEEHLVQVLNQKYLNFEVVFVDDNSDDDTQAIAQKLSNKYPNLKYYKFNQPKVSGGKKEALQFGIEYAQHDLLLLTDADCKPISENWIQGMANGFADGADVVLGVSLFNNLKTSAAKLANLDAAFIAVNYLSFAKINFPYMSVGRNVAYKKSIFNDVDGFKKHLNISSGDDDLFINSLPVGTKFELVYSKEFQTVSPAKQSFKEIIRQKGRHVTTGVQYKLQNIIVLGLYYSITTIWWGLFLVLIFRTEFFLTISTLVVLKNLTMYSFIRRIFSKIGVSANIVTAMILDCLSVSLHNLAIFYTLFKRDSGRW